VDDAEEYQRGPATKVVDLQAAVFARFERFSSARHPAGLVQHGAALGWRASLADALRMLKSRRNARRPVNGCGCRQLVEFQFGTPDADTDEINRRAPDTPVFVLHCLPRLADKARAARLRLYEDTPNPPAGKFSTTQRQSYRLLIAHRTPRFSTLAWPKVQAAPGASDEFDAPFHARMNRLVSPASLTLAGVPKLSGDTPSSRSCTSGAR